jgi:FkbM family methyltransferase
MPRLIDQLRIAIPFGLKAAVAGLIANRHTGALVQFMFPNGVPHRGSVIPLRGPEDARTAAKLFFGIYERAEIYCIQRYLPSTLDVIELGGSLGVTTCHISRKLAPSRRVICVEAREDLCKQIEYVLAANRLSNVTVVNRAIDYDSDTVTFETMGGTLSGRIGSGDLTINATTLSDLVHNYGLSQYSLVVDIEGAEVPLLLKDGHALAQCRCLLIEMDGGEYAGDFFDPDLIERIITAHGFRRLYRHGRVAAFARL